MVTTTPRPRATAELSADDARRIAIRAQGLHDAPGAADPGAMLRRIGAVQLDTISVLARAHELTARARLGAIAREGIEEAYWGGTAFEYLAHAACVLPMELWPYFSFRRRALAERLRLKYPDTPIVGETLARVREAPVTATDLGGARNGTSGWWSWSDAKRALELLYMRGDIVCTTRRRWQRVYDVPERAIPAALRAQDLGDDECCRKLVATAARALGVGTARDIGDYFMLCAPYLGTVAKPRAAVQRAIDDAGLVRVSVEGWDEPAFAHPEALRVPAGLGERAVLLSPFDPLIWDRRRTARLFGFTFLLEAYKPKEQRVHGYFSMPVLARDRLVGRVDPAREGDALVARNVFVEEEGAIAPIASALTEAAAWVGCTRVRVESVTPKRLGAELRRGVAPKRNAAAERAS